MDVAFSLAEGVIKFPHNNARRDCFEKAVKRYAEKRKIIDEFFSFGVQTIEFSPRIMFELADGSPKDPIGYAITILEKALPKSSLVQFLRSHKEYVMRVREFEKGITETIGSLMKTGASREAAYQHVYGDLHVQKRGKEFAFKEGPQLFNVRRIESVLEDHKNTQKERERLYVRSSLTLMTHLSQCSSDFCRPFSVYRRYHEEILRPLPSGLFGNLAFFIIKEKLEIQGQKNALLPVEAEELTNQCPDGSAIVYMDDVCAKIEGDAFPAQYFVYLPREPQARSGKIFTHDQRVRVFIDNSFDVCEKNLKGSEYVRHDVALRKKLPLALELLLDYAEYDAQSFIDNQGRKIPNLRLYGCIVEPGGKRTECQFEWGFDPEDTAVCYHWVAQNRPINEEIARKSQNLITYKMGAFDAEGKK